MNDQEVPRAPPGQGKGAMKVGPILPSLPYGPWPGLLHLDHGSTSIYVIPAAATPTNSYNKGNHDNIFIIKGALGLAVIFIKGAVGCQIYLLRG